MTERIDLLECADVLESVLGQIDLGLMPNPADVQFMRAAVASFRQPLSVGELVGMVGFADDVRRAATGMKLQRN
jgi:hypothetical protein